MKTTLIIQNNESVAPGTILDYMNKSGRSYQVIHSYNNNSFPKLDTIEAVINLGATESVKNILEHEYLKQLFAYLSEVARQNFPYLGICFGSQIMAKILGAKVEQNDVHEIGLYDISLTDEGKADPIFYGFETDIPVFEWHSDRFRIPFGATRLAGSTSCKNQAFRLGNLVGVQFHPEVNPEIISDWCERHADELDHAGKTASEVNESIRDNFENIKNNNFKLLDNFFNSL